MPPRQTQQTRETLLKAAFAEIYRQGFQAASLAAILRDTGLTKGALYHHFPTKRDLGLAVINEVIRDHLETTIFRPLRDSQTPIRTLREIIGRQQEPEFVRLGCPLNNLMQEMSILDEGFKSSLNAILADWGMAVEDALRRGIEMGSLRPEVNCRATALFIVSAWEGCIGVAKSLQSADGFSLCMQQLQDYLLGLEIDA